MAIPLGVILIWTGTNAGIPSGWTRETALDDKFPKAWGAENPNVSGGSNTHTHSAGHTHTANTHDHSFTVDTWTGSSTYVNTLGSGLADGQHNHSAGSVISSSGGDLQSTTVTWVAATSQPPYKTVIFIKPNGSPAAMASGICAHFNGASVPGGWLYCNGSAGTTDLRNSYLKGASAGADAGGSGGGTTHSHTIDHTHTADAHGHTGRTGANDGNTRQTAGSGTFTASPHTHDMTMSNTTNTVNSYTGTGGASDTVEVSNKKMGVIHNNGGGTPLHIIGLWLGSVSAIPGSWSLCDGGKNTQDLRNYFVKVGASLANNAETGGANTHSHTSVSHTHTSTGTHTHGYGSTAGSNNTNPSPGESTHGVPGSAHTHTVSSVGSATATYVNNDVSSSTDSNQPAYLTAAYIEYTQGPGGGILSLLAQGS